MRLITILLLGAAFAYTAGDPQGFYLWKAADLKAFAMSLAPKVNEAHVASEVITKFDNYVFQIAHREGSGEGEWHAKMADVFFVQSGEATLIYGGELVDGKQTAEGEMRAPTIRGGMEKKIAAGDVVTIP